ncbi:transcriptional regulator [Leptolyngbya sp. 'hensonii']|uniref:helix-turn-helix domain-containing protein n=1 Tax=Leptolyngbya sp. 'hensonii' TaxID=1922337 RepID=UPI00094FC006|nr:helix-turn-helix domain-containing protein [Leptolyngbya sp. 'hensonii']OLP16688.1 transcriptional regulator [Leptolyngbya sp. 'hensonii']
MPYSITNLCIRCDSCLPQCPTGAIKLEGEDYWIDPLLCNDCEGYYSEPQCVTSCPTGSPVPWQAKKGRCKTNIRTATSPSLFPDGKSHPFASAIVVWEACNVLAQRQSLPWKADEADRLYYQRHIHQGQGSIGFQITHTLDPLPPTPLSKEVALATLSTFDVRSACLHLIYAAHATVLERPWEQEFIINDQQIEEYLGLEKRKDLSKPARLALIKDLVQQPCQIQVSIDWLAQGRVAGFSLRESRLWHLLEVQHHFQEDDLGCKHLVGLTFKLRAGQWTQYFLNQQGYRDRTAFYQYGSLPKLLLSTVMSIWQQHEGAARMMLWLLFKAKVGREQRLTVPTLMRVAYGEERILHASTHREHRKRLLRTFESDLEVLNHHGLKPVFDPVTYAPEIQPLWARLSELPDDADAALEFWVNDGSGSTRLTDAAPRGKWNRLMHARILYFELPPQWSRQPAATNRKKQRSSQRRTKAKPQLTLSAEDVVKARKNLQWSQRQLAEKTGKSQSWIRDIENNRFRAKLEDQVLLRKVLGI